MPEMDGLAFIRELRSRPGLETVPAIALTGYASQTDAKAAISAGFDLHLAKPIDPSDLLAAIHNLIALRGRRQGLDRTYVVSATLSSPLYIARNRHWYSHDPALTLITAS